MRQRGTGHVHAHWATHSALAAWVIHRLTGLPYSFTTHADDLFVRRPMLEEKVRDASFVVTISEFNRRTLAEQLGAWVLPRVQLVRCGVDVDAFAPTPAPGAPFTILCVARLEEKKGHRVLLEACRRLVDRGLGFRCWLVGEGGERRRLERLRDEIGLAEAVSFLGAQPHERVRALLADAHVVALPCVVAASGRADGIPVALMEAMAMERPVVSTRTSGIPELVVDGESGLLTDPGDADALADALGHIASDPAFAAALAAGGRRAVRAGFDLERNVARLRLLFAGALESGSAGLAGGMNRGSAPGEALG
jgi:glycosyltransferase involved in cell wall biosynthesis